MLLELGGDGLVQHPDLLAQRGQAGGSGAGPSAWHVAVGGGTVAVAAALALGVLTAGGVPPTTSDPADLTTGTARPRGCRPPGERPTLGRSESRCP